MNKVLVSMNGIFCVFPLFVWSSESKEIVSIDFYNSYSYCIFVNGIPIETRTLKKIELKMGEKCIILQGLEGIYKNSFVHIGTYRALLLQPGVIRLSSIIRCSRDKIMYTNGCRFLKLD